MFAQWIKKLLAEARAIIDNPNSTDSQREIARKVIETHGGGNV